jgi:hypothetical protein
MTSLSVPRTATCCCAAMLVALTATGGCRKPVDTAPRPDASRRVAHTVVTDRSGKVQFELVSIATAMLTNELIAYLIANLEIRAVEVDGQSESMTFWRASYGELDDRYPEVKLELRPLDIAEQREFIYLWPEVLTPVRPGILRVRPEFQHSRLRSDNTVGVSVQPLDEGDFTDIRGTVLCEYTDLDGLHSAPLRHVALFIDDEGEPISSDATGAFSLAGAFADPGRLEIVIRFLNPIPAATGSVLTPLEIMDELQNSRNLRVSATTTAAGAGLELGTITVRHTDCELWNMGVDLLQNYQAVHSSSPPAGRLRFKRWSDVHGGIPHTYYDYIVLATNYVASTGRADRPGINGRVRTLTHEFGHSIGHVADGPEHHWRWDSFRFAYAQLHNINQISTEQFVFNEGFAHFYAMQAGVALPFPALDVALNVPPPGPFDAFVDWNESLVAHRLQVMSLAATSGVVTMVSILVNNRGVIHRLREFEDRYCEVETAANPLCGASRRVDTGPCPPGYTNDGATCRFVDVRVKDSYGRGVGRAPTVCPAGRVNESGLCYVPCLPGFDPFGLLCVQDCRVGYRDDSLSCRRDVQVISSNNSACPWWDTCGLTFARGCSTCPAGFQNDGCTCRIDADIYFKNSYDRGAGTVPNGCAAGRELQNGLCYEPYRAGFNGEGPVCWDSCPVGYREDGWTCWHAPHIFGRF